MALFRSYPRRLFLVAAGLAAGASAWAAEPPAPRGLSAIWADRNPAVLSLPFVTGGQVVVQWGEIETGEGRYDFSALETALKSFHDRGMPVTVQVNGNVKPAWLFDKVPYYPEKLSVQVRDRKGSLMYWHPVHRDAYLRFIRAYADAVRKSPCRASVIGIRQNFNPFGTEHFLKEKVQADPARWVVPPGAAAGPAGGAQADEEYRLAVAKAFVDAFTPDIRVLVRNNAGPGITARYAALFETGKLGWFHTSSEMEPRGPGGERQYQTFIDYCRSGKTLGYAESWADSWGRHGGNVDPRWCTPPQWNYWRLLCDLHCGVSCIAVYGSDLGMAMDGKGPDGAGPPGCKEEFARAFEFAARYAGFHASPLASPGAWAAFREGSHLKGDYTFLMKRLPDDTREVRNAGPDDQRYGAWARVLPKGGRMRLALDRDFAGSLWGRTARVQVVYLDKGGASWAVEAGGRRLDVRGKDSGRWQTATLVLDKAALDAGTDGAHLVITAPEADLTLHMAEVVRQTTP